MIVLGIILLCFGLSTLTALLVHLDEWWEILLTIIGLGIVYVVLSAVLFFLIAFFISLPIKKNEMSKDYNGKYRRIYNNYLHVGLSIFRIKIVANGLNKLPKDTNFVLVQNHKSNLDPMLFDIVLRRYPLVFIGKESLFGIPFFGKIISKAGYIKLRRTPCFEDAREMIRGMKMLENNQCSIALYPEGTRNKDYPHPELLDFKDGSLEIAKKCKKPIVISVVHNFDRKNALTFKKIQFDIVDVIYPENFENLSESELLAKVREIMLNGIKNPLKTEEFKHNL